MRECVNNIFPECNLHPQKRVKANQPVTWNEIKDFFSSPSECSVRVIYLDLNNIANHKDTVKYKLFDTCTHYFSEAGMYYYVYIRLLRNMLVWSAHPVLSGLEGVIGHHVSIGNKSNKYIDVHETMYAATEVKKYHIIARKKKRNYSIDAKTHHQHYGIQSCDTLNKVTQWWVEWASRISFHL